MNIPWMTVKRTNGQTFYFNMNQVGSVYENPADAEVFVYGNGWERKFRAEEVTEFIATLKAQAEVAKNALSVTES